MFRSSVRPSVLAVLVSLAASACTVTPVATPTFGESGGDAGPPLGDAAGPVVPPPVNARSVSQPARLEDAPQVRMARGLPGEVGELRSPGTEPLADPPSIRVPRLAVDLHADALAQPLLR